MKHTVAIALIAAASGAAVAGQAVKVEPTPTPGASSPRADAAKPAKKAEKQEPAKK